MHMILFITTFRLFSRHFGWLKNSKLTLGISQQCSENFKWFSSRTGVFFLKKNIKRERKIFIMRSNWLQTIDNFNVRNTSIPKVQSLKLLPIDHIASSCTVNERRPIRNVSKIELRPWEFSEEQTFFIMSNVRLNPSILDVFTILQAHSSHMTLLLTCSTSKPQRSHTFNFNSEF